jgi:2,4-dienoyl-CoA reductase-like NADH-dependent reductase (Old Yellow Enzyme family)/thioredoxin reductase
VTPNGERLYPHVFTPVQIAGVEIPNRIVRTAHGTRLTPGGRITDDLVAYHEVSARSGVGLTVLEIASVHQSGASAGIHIWDDSVLQGYEKLTRVLRRYPMKLFQQLMHFGHNAVLKDAQPAWSPSVLPNLRSAAAIPPLAMTKGQIDEIVASYAAAADRVVRGGLDGVEVHAGHGLLVGQFLSPITNFRQDEYGGSFENRARFLMEIMRAVNAAVRGAIPVGVRLSADELVDGGSDVAESIELVHALEDEALVDFVDLSVGSSYSYHRVIGGMDEVQGYQLPYAVPVGRAASVPSIVAGRIKSLEHAERIIAAGEADLVAMVRATIADPEIVAKSARGEAHRVRPCIGCNHGCVGGNAVSGGRIGCTVNPTAAVPAGQAELVPAVTPARVLVAGGGPAGLEAARVAAERGHHVVLCEQTDQVGGQLRYARRAPFRAEIGEIADWLESELRELKVDVRLNTRVTPALVRELGAEKVVIATGSVPRRDGFQVAAPRAVPGADLPHVRTSWDVLAGPSGARRAVVLDDVGHYEAVAAAETLLSEGAQVTFVTRMAQLSPLLEGSRTVNPIKSRFAGRPITVVTDTQVERIEPDHVTVRSVHGGDATGIPADLVVLVCHNASRDELAEDLRDQISDCRLVGDALSPRFLQVAISEGHRAGAEI